MKKNKLTNGEIGIELENTRDTHVAGNKLSGNVNGMLVVVLPDLPTTSTENAVIERNEVDVSKPAGTSAVIVVVPDEIGSNAVLTAVAAGPNESKPFVIAPTVSSLLVTGTETLNPPLIGWFCDQANVVGLRRAGVIWTGMFAANVLVSMLPGELTMNPDGSTVIVTVSLS